MGLVGFIVGAVVASLIYRNFPFVSTFFCSFNLCGTLGFLIFAILIAFVIGKLIHI